jgi:hypothetical protein
MEDFSTMSAMKKSVPCTKCGVDAPVCPSGSQVGLKDNPRISRAMGVHPSQIEAAMKKWPGSRYDKSGNLLIANASEKKARMRQRGYIEY